MNEYLYAQDYYAYRDQEIGRYDAHDGHVIVLTMGRDGCVVTSAAMLLSYFNNRAEYPDQFLAWLKANKGLTSDGRFYWDALCRAAGGKMRHSLYNNPQEGEITYALRKVYLGSGHWVLDSPTQVGKINDPLTGTIRDHTVYRYTGEVHYYFGRKL